MLRRLSARIAWTAYAVFVAYAALNVPVVRVMSTPMTWTMWRAAGGALSDSIVVHVTPANLLWIAITIGASLIPIGSPDGGRPVPAGLKSCATFCFLLAALGPTALAHVDTRGLDRNAWSALITTASRSALATLNGPRHTLTPTLAASSLAQPDAALAHLRGAAS